MTIGILLVLLTRCNPEEEDLIQQSDLDQWTYYKTADGLPSDNIISLYEDKKGRMWIGTDAGLSVYDGSTFTNYTMVDGLLSNRVYAVLEDKDGGIWAGTTNGLNFMQDGEWFYFTYFYEAPIFALLELPNSDILVGTGGYGVYQVDFDENTIDVFDISDNCLSCNSVFSLFRDSQENVWVGSLAGARRIKNENRTTFNKASGLSGDVVTSVREDSFGNVWLGCADATSVSRISGDHVEQIRFSNGAPQNLTRSIEMDHYNNIWIGTVSLGLYKYDGSFMHRVSEGPPGSSIQTMLNDKHGVLWIGTTTGLARYVVGTN